MAKADQLNEIIKSYLGEIITSEIESPNFLITISEVHCSSDLSTAKVFVSILPENFSGTALKRLRSKSGHLSKILKTKARLVRVPKLFWAIDASFKAVKKIGDIFEEIEKEDV
ncbi:ribosome-binding factor A [Candidatus Falkowbacteria bacterium HGW-Falkowbacteria-1]|uniref:Ribosome-binding factor A n=1 Tax=Candidatus Falkowbacteria bacterium HGW-Falkowbacteria-1 TaxID=2013768 RepID=A0A2N2E8N5_9BACT|nr:MAG: ribosome-binding factor A [Candidatus Falkowbacteria bacterium HGW-Falkowbacteria-1]